VGHLVDCCKDFAMGYQRSVLAEIEAKACGVDTPYVRDQGTVKLAKGDIPDDMGTRRPELLIYSSKREMFFYGCGRKKPPHMILILIRMWRRSAVLQSFLHTYLDGCTALSISRSVFGSTDVKLSREFLYLRLKED
jgi:hypothetical protein